MRVSERSQDRATPTDTHESSGSKVSKHRDWSCSQGKQLVCVRGNVYAQGILPEREKSDGRTIHLTVYEIVNKDFLKHLLCAKHSIPQTWLLPTGGLKPDMIVLSWSMFPMPDILLSAAQTVPPSSSQLLFPKSNCSLSTDNHTEAQRG